MSLQKVEKSKLYKRTRRLEVRPLTMKDHRIWRDFHLSEGAVEKRLTKEKFKKWLEQIKKCKNSDRLYSFAFIRKTDGVIVGKGSLMIINRCNYQVANLGYLVGKKYRKQGFATEGAKAIIDLGFKKIKLHRIEAGVEKKNKASLKVCKNLKMKYEGKKKDYIYDGKKWLDLEMYVLTTKDLGIKNFKPLVMPSLEYYL